MTWSIDPVGTGLVTSLARPGGNVTGLTLSTGPEFIAKQLQILNEAVPKPSRVGIRRQVGRAGTEPGALESAVRKLGLTVVFADVRTPSDLKGAFAPRPMWTRFSGDQAGICRSRSRPRSSWSSISRLPRRSA